ncbi:ABC transporter permease [bacterium]|nr:ABC transporter permease [bacterium]
MLKTYLKIALRNLSRQKLPVFINIFGLAVSLTLCLLTMGYIVHEYQYDTFHEHGDRIAQLFCRFDFKQSGITYAYGMRPLARALVTELPEVENAAVFTYRYTGVGRADDTGREGPAGKQSVLYADADFLRVFTFPLLAGSSVSLDDPFTVLLTQKAAHAWFGDENPIGRYLRIGDDTRYEITGVLDDVPHNSHLEFNCIASDASLRMSGVPEYTWSDYTEKDRFGDDYVYLLLTNPADIRVVEEKIPSIIQHHFDPETAAAYSFQLVALSHIYHSVGSFRKCIGMLCHCNMYLIRTASLITALILLVAVFNFVNLATARTASRVKEVGLRKVFGAARKQLVYQFLFESFLTVVVAAGIGLLAYTLVTPFITPLFGKTMFADFLRDPVMAGSVLLFIGLVSVAAGVYPAVYLSRFDPISVFRRSTTISSAKSLFRKVLVVGQFAVVTLFVAYTLVLNNQTRYMMAIDLGFRKNNIMLLPLSKEISAGRIERLKTEIERIGAVQAVTAVDHLPGVSGAYAVYYTKDTRDRASRVLGTGYSADKDFFNVFDIELVRGNGSRQDQSADESDCVYINESFAASMDMRNPIGYRLYTADGEYRVAGVFKDFYGADMTLHHRFPLYMVKLMPGESRYMCVSLEARQVGSAVSDIQDVWNRILPGRVLSYSFLDDEIAAHYAPVRFRIRLLSLLSLLSVCIACLGVFGFVSYATEQRTREVGIRKVLGASVGDIIAIFTGEFFRLITIAALIGLPAAFILGRQFSSGYAVQAPLSMWIFLITAGGSAIVVGLMIGCQVGRTALRNPVESLRNE